MLEKIRNVPIGSILYNVEDVTDGVSNKSLGYTFDKIEAEEVRKKMESAPSTRSTNQCEIRIVKFRVDDHHRDGSTSLSLTA